MNQANSISVIIPSYNSEDYISKCLQSIRNQTVRPKEIIVVDDCSKDKSLEVVQKFCLNNNLKIIIEKNERNMGPARSRMTGARLASSEYITFCDSDDWLDNNCFEIYDSEIKRFGADIVICGFKTLSRERATEKKLIAETKQVSIKDALVINHTSLCTMCIKKDLFLATNGPDLRNGEDKAIIPEILSLSNCIVVSNKCPYNYFYREGSASISANLSVVESLIMSWNYIGKTIGTNFPQETEYIGINHILCSTLLYLFKCSFDTDKAKEIIGNFEERYPNWKSNKYCYRLGKYKKLFLLCVRYRAFVLIKWIAFIHTIKSK